MFYKVLFRCENVGRQRDYANIWHFHQWIEPIFNSIEFLCLNKVNWVEKRLNSLVKMSKICKITLSADVFHSETKPQETFHCASADSFQFECDICDFVCLKAVDFSGHLRHFHGQQDKVYRCDQCDFSTFDKQSLIYHIDSSLQSGRCLPSRLNCDFCNTGFEAISPLHLIDHLKEFHVLRNVQPATSVQKKRQRKEQPVVQLWRMDLIDSILDLLDFLTNSYPVFFGNWQKFNELWMIFNNNNTSKW